MNNDINDLLRKTSREYMYSIWQHAKKNELDNLSNEDKQLAKIMLEHEDEFFNQFEFADVLHEYEYDPGTEVNPFLHIVIHSVIENQLESKDPIEVYQFYIEMRKKKVNHHDLIHLIGRIFIPFLFHALKQKTNFDMDLYKHLLKVYKYKKPDKIPSALEKDIDDLFAR